MQIIKKSYFEQLIITIITNCLMIFSSNSFADNLGVIGKTYPITEPDIITPQIVKQ